ncbi:MAG TPA: RagB/SusD family nutrient uptake outer membrane protein [Chitinophagaceae bacterium]|nr:RagB/SusD family nutrient uptake outer membrane protein [Chitinophagaceae bacterium]
MKIKSLKNKFLPLITVLLFMMSSCEKKVLDLQPYSSFSDQSAFADEAKITLAVTGVYDAAQSGFYNGGQVRGYPFGAASIEQGDMRGEDMANNAGFYLITYEGIYNNVTANNGFMFQTLYSLINKANLVIEGVTGAVSNNIISAAKGNEFIAECKLLRAMAHHELLLHFARPYADGNGSKPGVIYRDFGVNSEATAEKARAQKRSDFPVSVVYTRILEDLDFAEANLTATGSLKTYRASKAAAIALKMRVKMHKADWAGVITEGNKIVSTTAPFTSAIGGWQLTPSPDGAFANNTSNESIFSIKNAPTDNPDVNGALASMYSDPELNGRGLVRISPIMWSNPNWLCSDLRRTSILARVYPDAVFTNKYREQSTLSDGAPLIRYAEVLLTLAEAEARTGTGVSTRGLALLNAVRNRAVVSPADQFTAASFANKNALVSAILFERRIEFLAEGKRWGDLHRLAKDPDFAPITGGGIPAKVGSGETDAAWYNCAGGVTISFSTPAIPYSNFKFVWPIPLVEVQQNANYTQNEGY